MYQTHCGLIIEQRDDNAIYNVKYDNKQQTLINCMAVHGKQHCSWSTLYIDSNSLHRSSVFFQCIFPPALLFARLHCTSASTSDAPRQVASKCSFKFFQSATVFSFDYNLLFSLSNCVDVPLQNCILYFFTFFLYSLYCATSPQT